jgi:hypothetical protein
MLVRGGVLVAKRIARHLGRMCFWNVHRSRVFFPGTLEPHTEIAFGSVPGFIQDRLVFGSDHTPLILLIFWLVRVHFTNAYNGESMIRADLRDS